MKTRKTGLLLAAGCLSLTVLAGCSTESTKNYEQAAQDLEAGNYETALEEYQTAIADGVNVAQSYRGAGVAQLKLGNYSDAVTDLTNALESDKAGKALKKDILSYRAAAYLKLKSYDEAMADCQALAESYDMDADIYFLTGETALAMDSYEEASSNFDQAYSEDATYDRAIQIYGAYLDKDMEADGTRYLEAALNGTAKNAQDHCDRGRVYYYMDDYENAETELKQAVEGENTEALVLLGMVYMAQGDNADARTMFQQYVSQADNGAKGFNGLALCDIEDGDYDSALSNISSGIHAAEAEDLQSLLFNEIAVYEKKLDFETALQKTREYLELYPEDKTAKKELAFLKTRVSGNTETETDTAGAADTESTDSGQQSE